MKIGPENQRKREREKKEKGNICLHFGLQTSATKRDSSLSHMSVHLNKF